jgi:hypothetical protein
MGPVAALCAGFALGCGSVERPSPRFPVRFEERAESAGIRFVLSNGGRSPLDILETIGSGCALADVTGDGALDALLVGKDACRLFAGDGRGRFRDVSEPWGLTGLRGHWIGAALGDVDNDGRADVYLSGYRTAAFLHNEGARLRDVTDAAGLRSSTWSASAGFADLDGDGRLDLVVGNYLQFGPGSRRFCNDTGRAEHACAPATYPAEKPAVYRNLGNLRFRDVTRGSGLDRGYGYTLALAFFDFDRDGRPDIYLANDTAPGELWRNAGRFRFVNVADEVGCALGVYNKPQAGMGVDLADFDHSGELDLVVTAFAGEPYSLYRRQGPVFENCSQSVGIGAATRPLLGFGVRFADLDNDGWEDLVFANGHVKDLVHLEDESRSYRQRMQMFRNGGGWFEEVTDRAGGDIQARIVGRGLATGDVDGDGRLDVLVVDAEGRAHLLMNRSAAGNWVRFRCRGRRANRPGYGARIRIRAPGVQNVGEVAAARGYASSSDPSIHFGLGRASAVVEAEVRWPSGKVQRFDNVPGNREWLVDEDAGLVAELRTMGSVSRESRASPSVTR